MWSVCLPGWNGTSVKKFWGHPNPESSQMEEQEEVYLPSLESASDRSLSGFTEVAIWWLCWKTRSFESPVFHTCSFPFLAIGPRVVYNNNSTATVPSFIKAHRAGYKGYLCYPKDWRCPFSRASLPEPWMLPWALALSSFPDRQLSADNILLVPCPLPHGLFGEFSFRLFQWRPLSDSFIPLDVATV